MLDSNLPAVADTLQTLAQNSSEVSPGLFVRIMQIFSIWLIPVLIFAILILAWRNKVKVYEAFIDGAKEGFSVAIKIIPYLVAVLVAIGMFRASGAMDIFVALFSPITNLIGMPAETLPVALMRPLSCLLYTSPSPRDRTRSRMPSSACQQKTITPLRIT